MNKLSQKALIDKILESTKVDIDQPLCDFDNIFSAYAVLNRSTKSDSLQAIAGLGKELKATKIVQDYLKTANRDEVFVKIIPRIPNENSGDVEQAMYKYLDILRVNCVSPNIMRYVVSFTCPSLFELKTLTKSVATMITKGISEITKDNKVSVTDVKDIKFVVIELGKGSNLQDLLDAGVLIDKDLRDIFFQILYTLDQMAIVGVRHNDLYLGNIYINELNSPVRMIYFINDFKYYIVETRYIVKIFDFDRSAFTMGPMRNNVLDNVMCPKFGMCSNANPFFDVAIMMFSLDRLWKAKYPTIDILINDVVKNKGYLDKTCCRAPGRMCGPIPFAAINPFELCDPNFVPNPGDFLSFNDIMNTSSLYLPYVKTLNKDGFLASDIPIASEVSEDVNVIPVQVLKPGFYVSARSLVGPLNLANALLFRFGVPLNE